MRASLDDSPSCHPRRPPPPLPSPFEGGSRGGRRTATRRTDDNLSVAFVTVLAVVAVVVGALPPSPCDRPRGGNADGASSPANLKDLKRLIDHLAKNVKSLKSSLLLSSSPPHMDTISEGVLALLEARRAYATSNGGIGAKGRPWEEPMSKSEKKRLEKKAKKAKAAAAAVAGAGAGAASGGAGGDANANNQQPWVSGTATPSSFSGSFSQ